MALRVYARKTDIPKNIKLVDSNDILFNYDIYNGLIFDDTVKTIMNKVDNAIYLQELDMRSKFGYITSVENLSTGCKTMINIVKHSEQIINCIECGDNVLQFIMQMSNYIKGSVYLPILPSISEMKVKLFVVFDNNQCVVTDINQLYQLYEKINRNGG